MSALEHDELGYRARELRALLREWNATSGDVIRATIGDAAGTLERAEEDIAHARGGRLENFILLVAAIKAAGGELRLSKSSQGEANPNTARILSFRDAATGEYVLRLEGAE